MSVDDETPEREADEEWQFGEWAEGSTAPGGGGLLREILDAVARVEAHVGELRTETASLRGDLDAVRAEASGAVGEQLSTQIEQLSAQIDSVRSAIPSQQMARLAADLHELRRMLIGPD